MRHILCAVMGLGLATVLTHSRAVGQTSPPGQQRAVAGGPVTPAQTMDLASAKKLAQAAEAAAAAANAHVAICVMDTNGDVVLLERMNETGRQILVAAQGKARAVLLFGVPTGQISDAMREKKPVNAVISPLPLGSGG